MSRYPPLAFVALILVLSTAAPAAEIKSVSGAVGLDARERMMRSFTDYNLHLAFANTKGEFLADVSVAIRGADGNVLWRGISEGPYCFVRLPEGRYEVTADFGGQSHSRWIDAGENPGPMHYFHWR